MRKPRSAAQQSYLEPEPVADCICPYGLDCCGCFGAKSCCVCVLNVDKV